MQRGEMDVDRLGKSGAKSILSLKIFLYANKHLTLSKDLGNGKKYGKHVLEIFSDFI